MENVKNTKDFWNAKLYDNKHSFVSTFGNDLVEWLAPEKEEKILDLGCGTGDLAKKLLDYGVDVIGVDKSDNMVRQARIKYPNIHFIVCDATDLKYRNEFDAVFSNATLHWVKPPQQALHCIYQSLKQGGRFVAEFGGKGNVQIITDEIKNQLKLFSFENNIRKFPWYFPSIGEYSSLMEETGFRVTLAQHFDRPTELEGENGLQNWIEMFGNALLEGIPDDKKDQIIKNVENNLREILYHGRNWTADYKRIRVIGIKE
ncbi:class I SAM-dependent methyltransferase [Lederbergia wuyishanensis]|uniref:Ubiquinone/menaquinone biosynthesis C-methylase UbiE n=1 Tax=Lederbergia wuyishanensis TaxID=1347903 RepID=A0ABU0D3N2_9BACI|nr:class I SAM-dependent methyltransferase [Lederbergia wuyishanensis]MCJ8007822.1 methyltransferase domain-containing protein [Lederbergia wuyishanensis]MDQ0343010.1 ubiquinone/menaquinone biosynthesis C-methylase UbiE [Lederbergia wuyishanensis]